jgi:hypothetical protein
MNQRSLLLIGIGGALALVLGCRETPPSPASTTKVPEPTGELLVGKVTYRGAPVTGGWVILVDPNGTEVKGAILRNGTFRIPYLTVGTKRVAIETESIKDAMAKYEELEKRHAPGQDVPRKESVPVYVKIPEKYTKVGESGLTVTIKTGENHQDFDLKD